MPRRGLPPAVGGLAQTSEDTIGAMSLTLKLLGEFALHDKSSAMLSLPTRKTRALLAYLAVNADRPQPRERLMALLWSDRGEQQARQSLNQALQAIRKLGKNGQPLLNSDGERVTLCGAAIDCDVQRLRALAKTQPAEAATLYGGPFLDGLSIPDPAFEEWLLSTRTEIHALACEALEAAANMPADRETALNCARRLVTLDPLREAAHRRLIQLLSQSGDRVGALQQYQSCAEVLNRELDVEPDAATRALFEDIRRGKDVYLGVEPESELPQKLGLSRKPSIAVLPFDVIGGTPQIVDLADGLLDDLITALVKVRDLSVIERHSSEIYKGRSVSVRDVAKALGTRYVLTGSIRAFGDKLRCTAQLVDSIEGQHIWAERYDRRINDIFALQDEIVWHILLELQVTLTEGDTARIASRGTRNLQAWLLRVQGANELGKFTRQGVIRGRELFEAARKADPSWARPIAGIAHCYYYEARYGWGLPRQVSIARGIDYAEQAIAIDPEESFAYQALRGLNLLLANHDKALSLAIKAAELTPNDQLAIGALAVTRLFMDEIAAAIETFERVIRLGPTVPRQFQRTFGLALLCANNTNRAISTLEKLAHQEPEWADGLTQLAAAYVGAGRLGEAASTVRQIMVCDPTYTVSSYLSVIHFKNPARTEWLRDLLSQAGLPE